MENTHGQPAAGPAPHEINTLVSLLGQQRYAKAATLARAMTVRFPHHGFGWKALGVALKQMGQNAEALEPMQKAAALLPDDSEVYSNLGVVFHDLDRLGEAEASYRQALQINPGDADAHYDLGIVLKKSGRLNEAEASFRQALQIRPNHVGACNALGYVLKEQGKLGEAEAVYRRALQISPNDAEIHYGLGVILFESSRLEEAEASYRQALEIKPDYVDALCNLGVCLRYLCRLEEAEAIYRRALQVDPDDAESQWNLSLLLLTRGQFQCGWEGYETRWKRKSADHLPEAPYPCWLGEQDITGKKLLIQFEQGLGDGIQMLRYIPLLQQKNVECWIHVPSSLLRLVERSLPDAHVNDRLVCPDGLDYRIPVMSLPLAFRTYSEESIPKHVPYLIPDDERVGYWQKQLASAHKTVGLLWRGNPKQSNDRNRSASLADFLPLIDGCPSIRFVTMQKGLSESERRMLEGRNNVRILDDELADFDETAAVMCNLDIVISVCTGPAHLSAALARPTWILLWFGGDWRWMLDRADSPWYPTARLLRQKSIGNWTEVIDHVKALLLGSGAEAAA